MADAMTRAPAEHDEASVAVFGGNSRLPAPAIEGWRPVAAVVVVNGGPFPGFDGPRGGFRQPGLGRLHGREGSAAFLEIRSVVVNPGTTPGGY